MTTWATPYQPAFEPCSGSAQSGTIALAIVVERLFPGTHSLGIYNCREVGGGGTWSIHSDGRAFDCGVPMIDGRPDLGLGDPILALIARHAVALGVQCVIWNGRLYSARNPDGVPYGGVSPHYDHLHIEQQWYASQNLTVTEIAAILADDDHGGEGGGEPIPPPPIEEDEGDDMVPIIVRRDDGGTAAWLLLGSRKIYLASETNVQELLAAGGVLLTLQAAVVNAIPSVGA